MRQLKRATLAVWMTALLCAAPNESDAQLDNYHCFKVKDLKSPEFEQVTVALAAVPSSVVVELKNPAVLCAPTSANGSPVNDPEAVMCCYKAKGEKFPPNSRPQYPVISAPTTAQTLDLQLRKTVMFCEPCTGAFALP